MGFFHAEAFQDFEEITRKLRFNDAEGRGFSILVYDVFLGGGFKYFLFSPLSGGMIQFD